MVFTNEKLIDGAGVLLFPEWFQGLASELEDDLYILPSSIREVLAVPVSGNTVGLLRNLVCDMNARMKNVHGIEYEILSGNVYRYSLERGELTIT